MHHSIFDWIARVTGLVLAMMVTLSIIGAIAAIPGNSVGDRLGWRSPEIAEFEGDQPLAPAPQPDNRGAEGEKPDAAVASASLGRSAVPPPDSTTAWLEVIAYALIAIACLAALGIITLWRMAADLRHVAHSLER